MIQQALSGNAATEMIAVITRSIGFSFIVGLAALAAGCAAPQPRAPEPTGSSSPPSKERSPAAPSANSAATSSAPALTSPASDLPRYDPLAYLQRVRVACEQLRQYRLVFIRRERRGIGLLKSLHAPERIECWFRRSPFSIRMKWLDPDIKYGESTYVQGQDDDRLRFTPRPQLFNLPYRVYRVNPVTPVNWGECRYPVTEFGVEILMDRTLQTIAADPAGTRVTYIGTEPAPGSTRIAHRIRIDYPPDTNPAPVQELFIDAQTNIPLHTEMRFADGAIDTAYTYENLDPTVTLTDSDFVLEYDRAASPAATAGSAR
jgi:hypothetical protein